MTHFDLICLTETKCNSIIENEIIGYKPYVMSKKCNSHKYGGIHGICVFVKENVDINCFIVESLESESIVWLHITYSILKDVFILGVVYIPHDMSEYHHEDIFDHLANDIITIKAMHDVPIVLIGDFNARTGTTSDFEQEFIHNGLFPEEDSLKQYFEEQNIMNRVNKDRQVNKNGRKLIEFCKMSDMKIVNGRIGRDKASGNYSCYTATGKSTIDYAVATMDLFPNISEFYIDVLDKCMSDVHCPVCMTVSFNNYVPVISSQENSNTMDNSKYYVDNDIMCRWNDELREEYTSSFNMTDINLLQAQLSNMLLHMTAISDDVIDSLYTNMKSIFIQPAKKTCMYKEISKKGKRLPRKPRRHGKKVWFNDECSTLRKEYMLLKNSLRFPNASDSQHQSFREHAMMYKRSVSRAKKSYISKFHKEIRSLKTSNPREFWKVLKTDLTNKTSDPSPLIFAEFVNHFRELSSESVPSCVAPYPLDTSAISTNDAINQPFTITEIKTAIKQLKNNKASGADKMCSS